MKIWNNPFRKILLFSLLLLSFSSAQAEENQKETLLFLPLDNRLFLLCCQNNGSSGLQSAASA